MPPKKTLLSPDKSKNTLLSPDKRVALLTRLAKQNPNPKSELHYSNPFQLLCAVILSAQATDASVNKVTPLLFKNAPTAKDMVALGEEKVGEMVRTIGLWRAKAHKLCHTAAILDSKYGGEVPQTFDELVRLPGVGPKTANVVLNVAFGQPVIAVDTHIFRVCNRTGLCVCNDTIKMQELLKELVPDEFKAKAHHQLLLHGRYVCKARKPECAKCCVKDLCVTNTTPKIAKAGVRR